MYCSIILMHRLLSHHSASYILFIFVIVQASTSHLCWMSYNSTSHLAIIYNYVIYSKSELCYICHIVSASSDCGFTAHKTKPF